MKIKYFLIMLLAFVAISANAQTFQLTLDKNELIFTVTSETECSVKCGLNYEKNISIPETVTYEGKEYRVTSIEENGFKNHGGITSVNIPTSVTSIGNYAFYGCSALTSIAIPNSVTTIGTHAFMDCDHLTTADIPDSVTSIGVNAFYNCTALTTVTIPSTLTAIEEAVFYNCPSLTSITIPSTVTSIGAVAFRRCSSLTSITIPESVTSIGTGAFMECSGFTSVTIPSSVTSLDSDVFSDCTGLTSVTIPNSLTSISDRAFKNCTSLTSVTIPNSVTSIGDRTFQNCTSLTSVTIPNSVTSIGKNAFDGCPNLADFTVEDGDTSIKFYSNAIYDTPIKNLYIGRNWTFEASFIKDVNSVTLGEKVTTIPNNAFKNCAGMTSITIPNSVTSIGNYAFQNCTGLTAVTIPNSVTSIGQYAFDGCLNLADFTIEDGYTSIKFYSNAIYNTPIKNLYIGKNWTFEASFIKNVNSVTFGEKVTTIPNIAFKNCAGLTSITIPNSVTSIGDSAFYGCRGLTSVTIPNSVTSIGDSAFYGCSGLTSVTIPNSVTAIGYSAFNGCSGLKKSAYPNTFSNPFKDSYSQSYGITKGYESKDAIVENGFVFGPNKQSILFAPPTLVGEYTIPSSVTSIGQDAFQNCTGLTTVIIPNSVTSIGQYAFQNCTGLISITLPNSVTSIGDFAFYKCTSLTSVILPETITSIGKTEFKDCNGLEKVATPNMLSWYFDGQIIHYDSSVDIVENGFIFGPGKQSILFAPATLEGEYTIPNSVTSIGAWAFESCYGLTSVTIPNSVTSIGARAFDSCYGLTSVTIPNSVTSIGAFAFMWCRGLTSVTIPNSVTSINDLAFYGCNNLAEFTIEDGDLPIAFTASSLYSYDKSPIGACPIKNIYIGRNWTYNAKASISERIKSVSLGEKVTTVPDYAFKNCTNLTSIEIPNSVTTIGEYAFDGCSGLTTMSIPNSVTSIGNAAFSGCSGLKSIELGENLATIGADNLTLTNLTKIIIHSTTPPAASGSIASHVLIDVPAIAYPNYYANAYWKTYLNQMTINQIPKIEGPVDGTFIPGADVAYQNLTFVDPKTGRAYVTKAYGMDSENPYIYIEDYQTYPIAQPKPGEEDAVVAADLRFVIPNNFIASKTAKVGDELISADENMMWICESIPSEPAEGVKYYNIAVAGAKLNIADPKTGNIYQTQAHGLNTETPVLHLTNFETLPFATLQETDQNRVSANRFYVPANLTFTNNAPEWMADATFEKPMLWVCDAIPEEPGDAQFFSIPVSAVNLSDEFKANYTQIYIEDGGQPLYLYQNLPARFKQDMGETCAIDLYLGREAVNKSESTAIFGLGAATNSETYPLKSVTLGSMVRNIYNNTFAYANQLMSITFAGDDCLQNIGDRAFEGLRWSQPITFPKGLKEIGKYAFTENRFLNAISFSEAPQLTLREGAFQYCQRLASVNYASPISRISKYAFRYCESYNGEIDIKAAIIEESAFERGLFTNIALNVGVLGARVFRNIPTITSVTGKIGCIDQFAFDGCSALKSLEGNFDYINSFAFSGCTNLNTIDVTGTGAIRQKAFGALQKLETVKLDINSIEDYAFYDNSYSSSSTHPVINTLTFGDRVQSIGAYAFYYLNNGKSTPCKITFGSGLKNIGNYAFNYAYLDKVHFANVENGSAVMTVGDYAFNQIKFKNDILPVVSLGNTVKSIGNYDFQNVTLDNPVLATDAVFDLGTSIQSIGQYCFNCNRVSSVVIPGSLLTIGTNTLKSNLNKIVIAPGEVSLTLNSTTSYDYLLIAEYIELNRNIRNTNSNTNGNLTNSNTLFAAAKQMSIAIDPKSTYSGAGSESLYVKNLVLGKYCKNYLSAYRCQYVDVQDGVESIKSLTVDNHDYSYISTSNLGSRRIILPPSLGNITTFAINNNVADALIISDGEKPLTFGTAPKTGNLLNEIYVGRTTSLSNPANGGVFQGFPYLTKAVIGPKVAEITPAMFKDCPKITNIIFGREDVAEGEDAIAEMKLKKIGANAFQNCKGLQVLSLPETLEAAGADAFHGFQGLQRIVARGNTPALGTVTWGTAIENNAQFFYPTAAEDKYRASDMFYPFFNAGHAFTNEGNIADEVRIPITDDEVEDLDEVAAGSTYTLPAAVAFTTPVETESAPKMGKRAKMLAPRRVISTEDAIMPLSNGQQINTSFYWFAPRPDIASVDNNGKVTVHKNEPAEIWVYALDGSDRKAVIGINQPVTPGDLTRDNKLDSTDMLTLMLRIANEGRCSKISDVNADGELSATDVMQLMINIANK